MASDTQSEHRVHIPGRLIVAVGVLLLLVVGVALVVARRQDHAIPSAEGPGPIPPAVYVARKEPAPGTPNPRVDKPNIVVVMTDDQTLEEMRVMTKTNALLTAQGTDFNDHLDSYPLCCPSRATFLSGQYSHNHHVTDNVPPNGGYYKFDGTSTLPVWLRDAGYYTAMTGKYLNQYGERGTDTPPGWMDWFTTIDPSTYRYNGYDVDDNGTTRHFPDGDRNYNTNVITDRAVHDIEQHAGKGQPLFLYVAPLAPHTSAPEGAINAGEQIAVPAQKYDGAMQAQTLPRSPSFNQADVSKAPPFVNSLPRLTPTDVGNLTKVYQKELEALLSVDDAVVRIVDALKAAGQWDNTVLMFTSDNGLFHGEHRIKSSKNKLYDPSVRVPLVIAGPGFPRGAVITTPTANVDLAPTIVDLAGATPSHPLDGVSLVPIANGEDVARDRAIVLENETHNVPKDPIQPGQLTTRAIRTKDYFYGVSSDGFVELYDYTKDPDETNNVAGDPAYALIQAELAARWASLVNCAGAACEQ